MVVNLAEIDRILSEKFDFGGEEYSKAKDAVTNNIKEISDLLEIPENDDIVRFSTTLYKIKKQPVSVDSLKVCLDLAKEYSVHILILLPLLLTIETPEFIATEEEVNSLFLVLAKKAKFAAADLGDENNESFLKACVKVIDYSFFEEIEAKGSSVAGRTQFSAVIDDTFKQSLWDRIDAKVELLKHLKAEVFSDEGLLSAAIKETVVTQTKETEAESPSAD